MCPVRLAICDESRVSARASAQIAAVEALACLDGRRACECMQDAREAERLRGAHAAWLATSARKRETVGQLTLIDGGRR
jgi:hypothetical protein